MLEGRHQELGASSPLLGELRRKMDSQGLRPKAIVEYTREPFLYGPGNVRVTLDYNIRTALSPAGFLDPGCVTLPAAGAPVILEVKWDAFLPGLVRDLVQICRSYGMTCVAEGVETREQADALLEMGCVYAQGFYYDRPLPAEGFERKYLRRSGAQRHQEEKENQP